MFHKHKEGEKIKLGFSLMVADNGHVYGIAVNFFQLFIAVADWEFKRVWIKLDLTKYHRMYRPNDVDSWEYMVCCRCGKSVSKAPNVCSGKLFSWRKSWPRVVEEK